MKIVILTATMVLLSLPAHAACTWEDMNGTFHMTDERSQAPKYAKCDGDAAPTSASSPRASRNSGRKSSAGDLGTDMDGNHYSFDVSRIKFVSGTKQGGEVKMTQYYLTAPVTMIDKENPRFPNTAEVRITCGTLTESGGMGIQTFGRINLPNAQSRLLRKTACDQYQQ